MSARGWAGIAAKYESVEEYAEHVCWSHGWRARCRLEGAVPADQFGALNGITWPALSLRMRSGALRTAYQGIDGRWRVRIPMDVYRTQGLLAAIRHPSHWQDASPPGTTPAPTTAPDAPTKP